MNESVLKDMQNQITDLQKEVRYLSNIQQIHDLKYKYFHLIDHFQYGRMGEVFTEDADGLDVSPFFSFLIYIVGNRRFKKSLE